MSTSHWEKSIRGFSILDLHGPRVLVLFCLRRLAVLTAVIVGEGVMMDLRVTVVVKAGIVVVNVVNASSTPALMSLLV